MSKMKKAAAATAAMAIVLTGMNGTGCVIFNNLSSSISASAEYVSGTTKDGFEYENRLEQNRQDELQITGYKGLDIDITIPREIDGKKVTKIDSNAFEYNDEINSVIIPEGVQCIELDAFRSCHNLKSVTIPDSIYSVDKTAFDMCDIESVTIGKYIENNDVFNGDNAIFNSSDLKNVTLLDSVTKINPNAFYYCTDLERINIPNSVTSIGRYAFHNCRSLKSINIPGTVLTIEDNAFSECDKLESVTLGEGIKKIREKAFNLCPELKNVTVPNSVNAIGNYAFGYNAYTGAKEKIYGFKLTGGCGSEAERYADENKFEFVRIHNFKESITKQPTCTANGVKTLTCVCGEIKTESIPATGHKFGEWRVTKKPTTTETGLMERICSECGAKKTEIIPKLVVVKPIDPVKPTEPTKPTSPTVTVIAPKMVNTTSTNNSVKVRWNVAKNVDGYIITTYCDGKKVKSADVKKATVTTVGGLKISKNYLFGVKSYKTVNGKKVYSKEVGLKASTLPSAPKLTVKAGKKSAKLTWNKIPNATKYEVYMKVGKIYKKVAAVKGTSFTKKDLKSGVKYSFKVKTIKVANFKADKKYGMSRRTKVYVSKPSVVKTVKCL